MTKNFSKNLFLKSKISIVILMIMLAFFAAKNSIANPIISGISTNEIEIDTKFHGAKILLFGAKGDAGNIVIAVRGPQKNFIVSKKEKLFGIWYNGQRVKFEDSYSYYSIFSTYQEALSGDLISELELGQNNINFKTSQETDKEIDAEKKQEFKLKLIEGLEKGNLYKNNNSKIDFLDETLFKVMLTFPKNISRGVYTVEIYLINDSNLISFQAIPIYVNQVGLSARILDFAYSESFLYGLLSVFVALVFGWITNYLFSRFIGK
jgi:uncharacterized protein (TIGR02186 family)